MMNNRRFKFRPVLVLLAAPLLVLLCVLGIWQLDRRAWKLGLLAEMEAKSAEPAVLIEQAADLAALEDFTRITATVVPISAQRISDEISDLEFVPVALGDGFAWLQMAGTGDETLPLDLPRVELTDAQVIAGGWRGNPSFDPGFDAAKSMWGTARPLEFSRAVGLPVDQTSTTMIEPMSAVEALPGLRASPTNPALRNPHLSYAVQWFSFAALLLLFTALLSFPRKDETT